MTGKRSCGDGRARPSYQAKVSSLAMCIAQAATLLASIFREIFDESAYARFLRRHGLAVSRASYAAFLREQELIQSRPHRCC
jgi:hypothetical protein